MRIVHLQKYAAGFRGFLDEPDQWVLFQWTRAGGLRRLAAYAKSDFADYAHFTGVMGRFMPEGRFLPAPLETPTEPPEGLERLWWRLRAGSSGS